MRRKYLIASLYALAFAFGVWAADVVLNRLLGWAETGAWASALAPAFFGFLAGWHWRRQ